MLFNRINFSECFISDAASYLQVENVYIYVYFVSFTSDFKLYYLSSWRMVVMMVGIHDFANSKKVFL